MEKVSQKFPNLTQQVIPMIQGFSALFFFLMKDDKILIQDARRHTDTETLQHVCPIIIAGCWLHCWIIIAFVSQGSLQDWAIFLSSQTRYPVHGKVICVQPHISCTFQEDNKAFAYSAVLQAAMYYMKLAGDQPKPEMESS